MIQGYSIGILQGRLTKSPDGRLQYFPKDAWRDEFALARELGFDLVEPILPSEDYSVNPLWDEALTKEMKVIAKKNKIGITSACIDFFVEHPLHKKNVDIGLALRMLTRVIENANVLGIKTVVIPLLGDAVIATEEEKENLVVSLRPFLKTLEDRGMRIALELSLSARDSLELVERFHSPCVSVCYDLGNATSFGFSIAEEIRVLGGHIAEVHIKDRKRGGPSVPLGEGDAGFLGAVKTLKEIQYTGPLVFEAHRGIGDLVIENAKRNIQFLEGVLHSSIA